MSNPNNRKLMNDLKIIFMLFYCVSFSFEMDVEAVSESNVSEDSESNNRLDEIISDYRRVQEAATNEIDRKRRSVRSKCEERLWMAALWRDYQLEIVKKTFEAEIKQIEREHQVNGCPSFKYFFYLFVFSSNSTI